MSVYDRMAELKSQRLDREQRMRTALQNADIAAVDAVLGEVKRHLDIYIEDAYFLACELASLEMQNYLIGKVNNTDDALARAVLNKRIDVVQHIYPRVSEAGGHLALTLAVDDGFVEGVRYLLPRVEFDLRNTSILRAAAVGRNPEIFELVFQVYPLPLAEQLLEELQTDGRLESESWRVLKDRVDAEHLRATLVEVTATNSKHMVRKI